MAQLLRVGVDLTPIGIKGIPVERDWGGWGGVQNFVCQVSIFMLSKYAIDIFMDWSVG